MQYKTWLKALSLVIVTLTTSGCWTQIKHGPQYTHPIQPKYAALLIEPIVKIQGNTLRSSYVEINAALAPNGKEYYQIIQSRRKTGPAKILLHHTPTNKKQLTALFQKAHSILAQANSQNMQLQPQSLGCLGPKTNEVNCRDNGYAFYPNQMHIAISGSSQPYALIRVVESQHDRHKLEQTPLHLPAELAKVKPALERSQTAFGKLRQAQKKIVQTY